MPAFNVCYDSEIRLRPGDPVLTFRIADPGFSIDRFLRVATRVSAIPHPEAVAVLDDAGVVHASGFPGFIALEGDFGRRRLVHHVGDAGRLFDELVVEEELAAGAYVEGWIRHYV